MASAGWQEHKFFPQIFATPTGQESNPPTNGWNRYSDPRLAKDGSDGSFILW
jgi:hypothetical protein